MATLHTVTSWACRQFIDAGKVAADTFQGSAEGKSLCCGAAQMRLRNGGGQVFPSGKAMDGTATAEPRGRYNRSTHLVFKHIWRESGAICVMAMPSRCAYYAASPVNLYYRVASLVAATDTTLAVWFVA